MSSHIIVGTSITDTILGTNGNDKMGGDGIFYGLRGKDEIGFSGTAYGGAGDDIIYAQLGDGDVGYGGAGNDLLEGYYHSSPTFYGGGGTILSGSCAPASCLAAAAKTYFRSMTSTIQ